jgi:hypothetical protein
MASRIVHAASRWILAAFHCGLLHRCLAGLSWIGDGASHAVFAMSLAAAQPRLRQSAVARSGYPTMIASLPKRPHAP